MYILDTIEKEKIRRIKDLQNPSKNFSLLIEDFSILGSKEDQKKIYDFYNLLLSFEYSHSGLDKLAYMAHPIRVARLYISYCQNFCMKTLKLALAHNLVELTGIHKKDNLPISLKPIYHMIQILTVDRNRQWDWGYKDNYYRKISTSKEMSIIKVLDKLDNLYLLSDNPSKKIKLLYLYEIEKFVLPLASTFIPKLVDNINCLVSFNRQEIKGDSHEI